MFSDKELDILKLGLKTSFVLNKFPIEDLIVNMELGTKKIKYQNQDLAKGECIQVLKKNILMTGKAWKTFFERHVQFKKYKLFLFKTV